MTYDVLAKGNIPELLCGWATQILDNKPEVQKTAIETLPNIFHNALEFGDKDIAVGYLEEVLDNLFKVLDDPNARKNHLAAKDAISKIVDDILENGDPESVLVVSHILAEKCDIENATNPQTRETALENLQKTMFGANNPIANMEKQQAPESYTDLEQSAIGGRKAPLNKLRHEQKYDPESGAGPDKSFQSIPADPAGPYAAVSSTPTNAKPKQPKNMTDDTQKIVDLIKWNVVLQIVLAGLYWGHQWIGFWDLDFDMDEHVRPINNICWIIVPILLLYILQKFVDGPKLKCFCIMITLIIFFCLFGILLWAFRLTSPQIEELKVTVNGKINWMDITTLQIGDNITLGVDDIQLFGVYPSHSYRWSTGETTKEITISPDITTEYAITVININSGNAEPDRNYDDANILVIVGNIIKCDAGTGPNSGVIICNEDSGENICIQLDDVEDDDKIGLCNNTYSYFKSINKYSGMCPYDSTSGKFDKKSICSASNSDSYCDEYWYIPSMITDETRDFDYFQLKNYDGKCMINNGGKSFTMGICDDVNNIVNFKNYWYKEYNQNETADGDGIYFQLKSFIDNKCLYVKKCCKESKLYGLDASCGITNDYQDDVYWKIGSFESPKDLEQCKSR